MNVRWTRELFPPVPRGWRWRAVLPLLIFLALYGGLLGALVRWDRVMFERPAAFGLLGTSVWVWWLHVTGVTGLRPWRRQVALQVRLLLLGLLVALLAEPRSLRPNDDMSLMYVLDVSDSMQDEAVDESLSFVARTVTGKPAADRAGLAIFGRNAAVELGCQASFPFEGLTLNARVGGDGTNIARGLSLAAALLPEDHPARIVLISDGNATEGHLDSVLARLKARRIPVDVLPVSYDFQKEVWLERLDLPRIVRAGETYEVNILLGSLTAGSSRLVLRENGEVVYEGEVRYAAGKSRIQLPIYLRRPGYYEYSATIEPAPGEDGFRDNNTASAWLYIEGKGRVLLLHDPGGDERDWQPVAAALTAAGLDVQCMDTFSLPTHALSLLPYHVALIVNVPADTVSPTQQEALRAAVYGQGMGLVMIGGKNSFGPGGYRRTPIEQALPVTMDVRQRRMMPKGALAIILHTCEFPEGNTWGKRIAKEAMKVLGPGDEVGILAYGYQGGEKWIFPLTPMKEYQRLVRRVNQAQIGDMPSFATCMTMGLKALEASDAAAKHMVIISDGDPSPPPPELVGKFIAAHVSISMVAIFPHGGMDQSVMQSVARATGGRYYFPNDPSVLPAIFIKEAKTLRRTLIQNKTFLPVVAMPTDILKGIDAFPPLHGYVLTTAKPRAVTILEARLKKGEADPILAVWRYGIGKAAAFTSDLSYNWGKDWVNWEHYRAFVRQLVTDVSGGRRKTSLHVTSFAAGRRGVIMVEDAFKGESLLDLTAEISGPDDRIERLVLKQSGPRRYEGRFELWGRGRYRLLVGGSDGKRQEQALGGFVVNTSLEYKRFRSNPVLLEHIANVTRGRVFSGEETGREVFPADREVRLASQPLALALLMLLAFLLPLDVAVRRIQLDWEMIVSRWRGKDVSTVRTQTVGVLLTRARAWRGPDLADKPKRSGAGGKGKPKPKVEKKPTSPPESAGDGEASPAQPQRTTDRLLARKRQWKSEKK